VEETGLDIDAAEIDFSVKGKKNMTPSAKKEKSAKKPRSLSKVLFSHNKFSKSNKSLKELKKSPTKTLTQKLVVKMAFGPPKTKNRSFEEDIEKINEANRQMEEEMKTKSKVVSVPTVTVKSPTSDQTVKTKKRKKSTEKDMSRKKIKVIETNSGPKGKTLVLKASSEDEDEEVKEKRAKVSGSKGKGRRKSEAMDPELMVLENIRKSSRSERYRRSREARSMSEEEDTEASREAAVVPERYDPTTFTEDDDKGRLVVNLVYTSVIPLVLPGIR